MSEGKVTSCMDGWMDGWMDGCVCMYVCMYVPPNLEQIDGFLRK